MINLTVGSFFGTFGLSPALLSILFLLVDFLFDLDGD